MQHGSVVCGLQGLLSFSWGIVTFMGSGDPSLSEAGISAKWL